MTNLEAALEYQAKGYSVIPVNQKKVALVKWEPYQKERASEEKIRAWWKSTPKANIGIVTGAISNLLIVDADTPEAIRNIQEALPETLTVPCQSTPSGGMHFLFSHEEGFVNRARVAEGIDVRTTGGYFTAAPSVNGNGKAWKWLVSPLEANPPAMVLALKKILRSNSLYVYYREGVTSSSQEVTQSHKMFSHGTRDDDLFHVANQLVKTRTKPEVLSQVIEILAKNCDPPFPESEIQEKIKSAIKRAERKEKNIAEDLRDWAESQEGHWRVTNYHTESQVVTREDKHAVIVAIKRLQEHGVIKKYGNERGVYTRVEDKIEEIDWEHCDDTVVDVIWPFCLEKYYICLPKNIIVVAGSADAGKALANGTPILTPSGCVNIEDLKCSDEVFSENGKAIKVLGVYPQGVRKCYRFIFNDKTWIDSDEDHIWKVQTPYARTRKRTGHKNPSLQHGQWSLTTTRKMVDMMGIGKVKSRKRFKIPMSSAVEMPGIEVPLDPYIMGVLIGDGSFKTNSSVCLSTADEEIINYLIKNGIEVGKKNKKYDYRILKVQPIIRGLGLYGKRSHEKFIPDVYLKNDISRRCSLLQGLMDTDGYIEKTGKCLEYSTVSEILASNVVDLVRGLGGEAVLSERVTHYKHNGEIRNGKKSYRVFIRINTFNPFKLKRKAERWVRLKLQCKMIWEIQDVGNKETTCIKVENDTGLFIAKDYIVTHNTAFCLNFAMMNMDVYPIKYFSSEMGALELKSRLKKFPFDISKWNRVKFIERSLNFADVIDPDGINVVDYIEVPEEAWKIATPINEIFRKLERGICVIALQKPLGRDVARGGEGTLDRPRLYLSMGNNKIKIIKCKNWASGTNPKDLSLEYKIAQGCTFTQQSEWGKPGEEG